MNKAPIREVEPVTAIMTSEQLQAATRGFRLLCSMTSYIRGTATSVQESMDGEQPIMRVFEGLDGGPKRSALWLRYVDFCGPSADESQQQALDHASHYTFGIAYCFSPLGLREKWQEAEEVWRDQLVKEFGAPIASDMRNTERGRGAAGTPLNRAYSAYMAASLAYRISTESLIGNEDLGIPAVESAIPEQVSKALEQLRDDIANHLADATPPSRDTLLRWLGLSTAGYTAKLRPLRADLQALVKKFQH